MKDFFTAKTQRARRKNNFKMDFLLSRKVANNLITNNILFRYRQSSLKSNKTFTLRPLRLCGYIFLKIFKRTRYNNQGEQNA